jgi:5-methylcytosine-specific restriction endonuclease McrA
LTATAVVDHVEPHDGDMAKFWNRAMWQPACAHHHDVVKQKLERMWRDGRATKADLWLNSALAQTISRGE